MKEELVAEWSHRAAYTGDWKSKPYIQYIVGKTTFRGINIINAPRGVSGYSNQDLE